MVRLVVTGHDQQGSSIFTRDEDVTGVDLRGVGRILRVWGADGPMASPDDGTDPAAVAFFPPVGGVRCTVVDLVPEGEPASAEVDTTVINELLPGLFDVMEPDEPGMHRTHTIDFGIVLSGTPVLELDDGREVPLSPGDVVVQNGTRHRWRSAGDGPTRMVFVIVGANRSRPPEAGEPPGES
jgi:mannose-6-phosphate isomerase-like protein (cupin superfamily)